jgi:hypothetical protein
VNQSINSQIESKVKRSKPGQVFLPSDFKDLGTSTAIRKSLSRLVEQKKLVRIGQGIYVTVIHDKVFGDVLINSGAVCVQADTAYSTVKRLKCGAGTIERIWVITKQTAKGPITTTCKQIIRVLPLREYNICFPKDANFDCKTPIVDTLIKDELGCDLLAVNVTDKRYDASDDECAHQFQATRSHWLVEVKVLQS